MPAPDPASPLAAAIHAGLRSNEIGAGDPYALSFAGAGPSGPSFGVFQADLFANRAARGALLDILLAAHVDGGTASAIVQALGRPLRTSPLSKSDQDLVSAALAAPTGRAIIDALDRSTFETVLRHVGTSIDAATAAGLSLAPPTTICIALWCNMSGAPTTLNTWLGGHAVTLAGGIPPKPRGPVVTQDDVMGYLRLTQYFQANPRDLPHFEASVGAGLAGWGKSW